MSFQVVQLWAFLSVGDDGEEGLIGASTPSGAFVPFVAADLARMEAVKQMAIEIARKHAATIRLVRFNLRTDIEMITPAGDVVNLRRAGQ